MNGGRPDFGSDGMTNFAFGPSAPPAEVVAGQRAGIVAGAGIEPVIDPLLLHEFELPKQTCTDYQHDDAVLALVGHARRGIAVGQAAPDDATTVGEHRTDVAVSPMLSRVLTRRI